MLRILGNPLTVLVFLGGATTFVLCGYVYAGVEPSALANLLLSLALPFMVLLWMDADAHWRRRIPCFDFGFLATIAFPVSFFWYCFWSRGWRGFLLLAIIFGVWLIPYILATMFAIALYLFTTPNLFQ